MAWSKLAKHLHDIAEGRPEPAQDRLGSGHHTAVLAERPTINQPKPAGKKVPDLRIHRSQDFWIGVLTAHDGGETFVRAKSLRELKDAAEQVLASTDVSTADSKQSQSFRIQFDQPRQALINGMRLSKEEAERAAIRARTAQREAVTTLRQQGITMQDIADMMGITKSRVSQLANGK